jgi:hypothetical protein
MQAAILDEAPAQIIPRAFARFCFPIMAVVAESGGMVKAEFGI